MMNSRRARPPGVNVVADSHRDNLIALGSVIHNAQAKLDTTRMGSICIASCDGPMSAKLLLSSLRYFESLKRDLRRSA